MMPYYKSGTNNGNAGQNGCQSSRNVSQSAKNGCWSKRNERRNDSKAGSQYREPRKNGCQPKGNKGRLRKPHFKLTYRILNKNNSVSTLPSLYVNWVWRLTLSLEHIACIFIIIILAI